MARLVPLLLGALVVVQASAHAAHVRRQQNSDALTFTYLTLNHSEVTTATTTYKSGAAPTPGFVEGRTPTRYELNRNDLVYPTPIPNDPDLAKAAAAPGLPDTMELANDALALIGLLMESNSTNCRKCQDTFAKVQTSLQVDQELIGRIAVPFCEALPFLPFPLCVGLLRIGSTDVGAIFGSWAFDFHSQDGELACAYLFGLCDLPPPPTLDLPKLFRGTTKPPPKTLTPSTNPPLKVLHFSDYHLDPRYVVGSEAQCGGGVAPTVCCRFFPYSNASAPIVKPAELFGDYLCDTPEPLATSVFRNVPKATGSDWSDFAFGIFTGDLVSHDIWELTSEYVLANELTSYQQFFDGMGGVKLYPTLGNHDTYPQAFTSTPSMNMQLPRNSSYPVQAEYNHRAVSMAWENYGWLSEAEAQSVIASGLGIYRALTKEGLVIISLNSDTWYYFNLYAYMSGNDVDPTGMFAKLIDYLLEAEEKDQPVWIIQHVNVGGSTVYESLPAASDLYYQIVDRFSNNIRGVFFGHTHDDEFSIFYANNGTAQTASNAIATAYIMPSVTPYQSRNAGFRYYSVDADTFEILDSVTYYANISNSAQWRLAGDVTWELEYSARETYAAAGALAPNEPLSAAWWHNVTEMIRTDPRMYRMYTDLRRKKYRPYEADDAELRNQTLCGLRSMSVPLFEECLGSRASTSSFL